MTSFVLVVSVCHVKVHKDHYDKQEEFIGYCKGQSIESFMILVDVWLWRDAGVTSWTTLYTVRTCSELQRDVGRQGDVGAGVTSLTCLFVLAVNFNEMSDAKEMLVLA